MSIRLCSLIVSVSDDGASIMTSFVRGDSCDLWSFVTDSHSPELDRRSLAFIRFNTGAGGGSAVIGDAGVLVVVVGDDGVPVVVAGDGGVLVVKAGDGGVRVVVSGDGGVLVVTVVVFSLSEVSSSSLAPGDCSMFRY